MKKKQTHQKGKQAKQRVKNTTTFEISMKD